MKSNFVYRKIGDLCDVTKLAGFEFTKYINYSDSGDIIALRALNLRNGFLDLSDIKKIDKETSDLLIRSKLYIGDIVLTYTGNGYGDCALINENNKYHLAPNICKISPSADVDSYYLYSIIRTNWFKKLLTNYIGGSGQPTIPMKTIRQLEIPLSSLNIQKKISQIIRYLDEKIILNNKINDNLQQQAFALFEERFPNIREGESRIGDYLSPKRGKNLLTKDAVKGTVPVIAGGLEPSTYHNKSNTGAPVITISASGANAGFINLWNVPVWSSDSSFIDESVTRNIYFWYVLLKKRQQEIFDSQTGSAQAHIYPKHIEVMPMAKINDDCMKSFNELVSPLFMAIGKNNIQNKKLSELRDALLPKLMSGEIDVSDIKLDL